MSSKREMIGSEDISRDPELKEAAARLLASVPDGTAAAELLNLFFTNKDSVPKDVLVYFCRSEFFSLIVDEAAETVAKLIDFEAESGWYELIGDVCRNKKNIGSYCREIYDCFTQHLSVDETKALYEVSEKPSDISAARKKSRQNTRASINKKKADYSDEQKPDNVFWDVLNRLDGNYEALNREYHDLGLYLTHLMKENQKIRAAHFESQTELDVEKEKNAVLTVKLQERENMILEMKTQMEQLKEKESQSEHVLAAFPIEKLDLIIAKSDVIIDAVNQLSLEDHSPDRKLFVSGVDVPDTVTGDDLNFVPDFTEEELSALEETVAASDADFPEPELPLADMSAFDDEFGVPDKETLNLTSGTTDEMLLFDPETSVDLDGEWVAEGEADNEVSILSGKPETIEIRDHYEEIKKRRGCLPHYCAALKDENLSG